MGQEFSEISFNRENLTRHRFEFLNIIGRGGFGKVWKVIEKKYKIVYALKEMQKVKVIDKKSINSIKNERELLSYLKHPFIVNMHVSFQDYDHLYLVLDFLQGGDLRYHVSRFRKFSEEQTRFFIACILVALEYIHLNNIIHRDIKPENLVFDENGYLRITDFGIAKRYSSKNNHETSGTPGYMSPEVMKGANHSYGVDYFAVGVIGHEFMLGRRPYVGKTRKEIKEQMMTKQVEIQFEELPDGWSTDSLDFINKLLQRKPENRLGYNQESEIKEHPWLKFYPWDDLMNKQLQSPFLLEKTDNFDKRYCEQLDKIGIDTHNRYEAYKVQDDFTCLFENFTYCKIEEEKKILEDNTKAKVDKSIDNKKKNSKSTNSMSRQEKQEKRNKHNSTHTLNSNDNQTLMKTNSNINVICKSDDNKKNKKVITINSPKNDAPIYLLKNNLNILQKYSASFHSNTKNKTQSIIKKENNIGKAPKRHRRTGSNLSASPFSDKYNTIEFIQKNKDNQFLKGSFKSNDDPKNNTGHKFRVLSPLNKPGQKHQKTACSKIPFDNQKKSKQTPRQKVDFTAHHKKNVSSQCTPMISTNCTINQSKKYPNEIAYLANIPSAVSSLLNNYKINFNSKSSSSSGSRPKTAVSSNNNNHIIKKSVNSNKLGYN